MENLGCVTFRETALLVDPERSTQGELQRVEDGGREPGVRPGDMIEDPKVKQHSREVEAEHRRAIAARPSRVSMAPAGGILMLCAAALLVWAQLSMFPQTRVGEANTTWTIAPSAALAICGLNAVARPAQAQAKRVLTKVPMMKRSAAADFLPACSSG